MGTYHLSGVAFFIKSVFVNFKFFFTYAAKRAFEIIG